MPHPHPGHGPEQCQISWSEETGLWHVRSTVLMGRSEEDWSAACAVLNRNFARCRTDSHIQKKEVVHHH